MGGAWGGGKGSGDRTQDHDRFGDNFDRIFGPDLDDPTFYYGFVESAYDGSMLGLLGTGTMEEWDRFLAGHFDLNKRQEATDENGVTNFMWPGVAAFRGTKCIVVQMPEPLHPMMILDGMTEAADEYAFRYEDQRQAVDLANLITTMRQGGTDG